MARLRIRKYGDPVLRKKASPITEIDEAIRELAEDMIETMQDAEGVGLAAPQVGESLRLFVVDIGVIEEDGLPRAFVNAEILSASGEERLEEGCLSIPGITEDVVRPSQIKVRYTTLDGETVEEECEGLLARVIQHEVDHLNGVFFIDRISPMKRRLLEKRLRKIAEEARAESVTA
jgi:peptide deformylase